MLHSRSYRPANLLIRTDSKQRLQPCGPSSLSREGNVLHAFLLYPLSLLALLIFTKIHSASILQSHWIARSRAVGLPTYDSWLIPTCEAFLDSHGQRTCRSRLLRISRSINSQTYLVHPCNSPDNKKRQRNFLPLFDVWRETLPMCNLKSDCLMSVFLYVCNFPRYSGL